MSKVIRWTPFTVKSATHFSAGLRWVLSWLVNQREEDLNKARAVFSEAGESQVHYLYWAFVEDKLGHAELRDRYITEGKYSKEVYNFYFGTRDLANIIDYHLMDLCTGHFRRYNDALRKYAAEHGGVYPEKLTELAPTWMEEMPTCPASGRETYSQGYQRAADGKSFRLQCDEHRALNEGPLVIDQRDPAGIPAQKPGLIDDYKIYHMLLGGFMDPFRQGEWAPRLLEHADLKPGETVADVGSGPGLFTFPFAERVGKQGKVYAVDINKSVLEYVRFTAERRADVNIETVLSRPSDSGLPAGAIDALFVIQTYHAMVDLAHPDDAANYKNNLRPWIETFFRALRPGGRLIIQDVHLPAALVRTQVEGVGFTTVKQVDFGDNYILVFTRPH